jgi:hypothetical protein
MEWLCRAQDASGCGGVSGAYALDTGWLPPYPETTGYIIPTFLQYATLTGDEVFAERAARMGDWEIDVQLQTGAVRGGIGVNEYPIVFNTGQVIKGWIALYRKTNSVEYLKAARRAADWLVENQDEDGKWSRHTFRDIPHAYHTRVAWPLMEAYDVTGNDAYRIAGEKNASWALSLASKNGFFEQAAFGVGEAPFTHTIAYTIRGLLEVSRFASGELAQRILDVVLKSSSKLMMRYELRKSDPYSMPKHMYGTFNEDWKSKDAYSCLTGNVQIAIIWLKLFGINGDARFVNSALKIIDQVKAAQVVEGGAPAIRGGIPGSYPIWGDYARYSYPNWAAKFFADAVMLQESVMRDLQEEAAQ